MSPWTISFTISSTEWVPNYRFFCLVKCQQCTCFLVLAHNSTYHQYLFEYSCLFARNISVYFRIGLSPVFHALDFGGRRVIFEFANHLQALAQPLARVGTNIIRTTLGFITAVIFASNRCQLTVCRLALSLSRMSPLVIVLQITHYVTLIV